MPFNYYTEICLDRHHENHEIPPVGIVGASANTEILHLLSAGRNRHSLWQLLGSTSVTNNRCNCHRIFTQSGPAMVQVVSSRALVAHCLVYLRFLVDKVLLGRILLQVHRHSPC